MARDYMERSGRGFWCGPHALYRVISLQLLKNRFDMFARNLSL